MSHYKPYPAYKLSGVDWIGRVPEHWSVCKLNFRFSVELGKMLDQKRISGEHLIPYLRNQDVQWAAINAVDLPVMDIAPDEYDRYTAVAGDLLVCEGGDVGRAAIWTGDPIGYQKALHRLRPRADDQPSFMLAMLVAAKTTGVFSENDSKATISHLPAEAFRTYRFPFPPPNEQSAIASALDRETARIDALIAKKTRFIELLKEKRQALITHAVTKGLDPSVKMKDSGVEWIGEVPEHWALMKFRRVARVTEGLVDPRREPYLAMPLFAPNHIESGTGRLLAVESAAEQDAESGKYLCNAGHVVYSKIRPALSKVIIAPTDGLCSADMYPLTCTDKAYAHWLFYLMLSQSFTSWAVLESDRVAMPKINREALGELVVAVPPVPEQKTIASALAAQLPRVDAVIERVDVSIALLKERRAALIAAAVTGQIDLRPPTESAP